MSLPAHIQDKDYQTASFLDDPPKTSEQQQQDVQNQSANAVAVHSAGGVLEDLPL